MGGDVGSDDDHAEDVVVYLRHQQVSGPGRDRLGGLERVIGGFEYDRLVGTARANALLGSYGDDLLRGGAGPDILRGGPDADIADGGSGRDGCDAETTRSENLEVRVSRGSRAG